VLDVGVPAAGVAVSQLEGRGGLPVGGEAVDALQFVGAAGGAEFVEQAASADGLELVWVADQGEAPVVFGGERREPGEGRGADHAGFVDEHCCAGRESVARVRWPVGALPLVKQLGDRVGRDAGLAFEHTGGLG
jgi:hypothetical protein